MTKSQKRQFIINNAFAHQSAYDAYVREEQAYWIERQGHDDAADDANLDNLIEFDRAESAKRFANYHVAKRCFLHAKWAARRYMRNATAMLNIKAHLSDRRYAKQQKQYLALRTQHESAINAQRLKFRRQARRLDRQIKRLYKSHASKSEIYDALAARAQIDRERMLVTHH